ncbi:DUF2264 domain-containing protein [Actinomycetes bacterium KLBMP 9797]
MIPDDRQRSPYTGWTRAHWEAAADRMLAAVRPYASPGHALIDLPGPTSMSGRRSDGLEGFARTFLAAGFRLARSADGGLAQWYAEGLAAGTDPGSPERWPRVTEVGQAKVEAASVVLALHESRHVLWDALDDRVRERVVDWLAECLGQPYPQCNWLWFQNVVHAFLRSVGGPWSAEEIERNLATVEGWYLGDGWYTDGYEGTRTARKFDWYAGWAMNFYPLWYCRMSGDHAGPQLWARHRERLRSYLEGAQHLYAPDGPPLHQGRSVTYRYAALAPVWAGAVFDATPLPPGRTRRLASGVLRHFAERASADGLQPVGWYGAFDAIRQPYTGAGSPYWSSKGFAGLVLPADHPVWTDTELPLEVEERDVAVTLPVPGWVVSGTRADGVVRVVNHGADHADDDALSTDDPGYSRHGYATHAGPEYDDCLVDSHVALLDPAGNPSHRRPLRPLAVRGRVAVSRHRAHWPVGDPPAETWPPRQPAFWTGPWVTTASVLRGAVEVRLARVDGSPDGGPWRLRVGGYALADGAPPLISSAGGAASAHRPDGLTSTVVGLRGLPDARVVSRQGTNAYGPHSAVPVVDSDGPVRLGEVYAAAVVLGTTTVELPTVAVSGADIAVRWPDGEEDLLCLEPPD